MGTTRFPILIAAPSSKKRLGLAGCFRVEQRYEDVTGVQPGLQRVAKRLAWPDIELIEPDADAPVLERSGEGSRPLRITRRMRNEYFPNGLHP
jgi:hypothetical protein